MPGNARMRPGRCGAAADGAGAGAAATGASAGGGATGGGAGGATATGGGMTGGGGATGAGGGSARSSGGLKPRRPKSTTAAGRTGAGGGAGTSDSGTAVGNVGSSGASAGGAASFCVKRAFVIGTPISSGTSATTTRTYDRDATQSPTAGAQRQLTRSLKSFPIAFISSTRRDSTPRYGDCHGWSKWAVNAARAASLGVAIPTKSVSILSAPLRVKGVSKPLVTSTRISS